MKITIENPADAKTKVRVWQRTPSQDVDTHEVMPGESVTFEPWDNKGDICLTIHEEDIRS